MAIRPVLQLGDPRLRMVAEPVADPAAVEVGLVVEDMKDTLAHWRATTTYGRGIAAPQIGVMQRIVFLNVDRPWPLINPEILARSPETMIVWDACLSFLSIFFQVTRNCWVDIRYQDLGGAWHEFRAEGDLSELLQHEIDHLDGILALDRMTDVTTMCVREEFEKRHRPASPYAAACS
jgi:peptide deformylase